MSYIEELQSFDITNLPNLDVVVMGALELFIQKSLPTIDVTAYKRPLVVGSGNAEATGKIMFENTDAIFASESSVEGKLKNIPAIDGVVLLSASGGKHAPIIAKMAKDAGKPVTLITNTAQSAAFKVLDTATDKEYVLPKNREPYSYNTSTYMGMMLTATHEDPAEIKKFIDEKISNIQWPDFSAFTRYYIIVPPKFSGIIRMVQVKFIELFGRNIARDVETSEYVRHATTIAPSEELFISFGEPNVRWGKPENRLFVPLPSNADYAAMMAISYYVVAQIQKVYPNYFKDNVGSWATNVSQMFNELIEPIVPGN